MTIRASVCISLSVLSTGGRGCFSTTCVVWTSRKGCCGAGNINGVWCGWFAALHSQCGWGSNSSAALLSLHVHSILLPPGTLHNTTTTLHHPFATRHHTQCDHIHHNLTHSHHTNTPRRELRQVAGRAEAAEAALQQQAASYEARLAKLQAWYGKQAAVVAALRKGKALQDGQVGFTNTNRWGLDRTFEYVCISKGLEVELVVLIACMKDWCCKPAS